MAHLIVVDARGRRLVDIDKPLLTIGRRTESDVQVAGVDVSRQHAELQVENGIYTIRDCGSRFGLVVNGEPVSTRVLSHGDHIRLGKTGNTELTFLVTDEAPSVTHSVTAAALAVVLGAPALGAIADGLGRRKPWLLAFTALTVAGTLALWLVEPSPSYVLAGQVLYAAAATSFGFAMVFYDAMLRSIAPPGYIGRLPMYRLAAPGRPQAEHYLAVPDRGTLATLVNYGCLSFHPWSSPAAVPLQPRTDQAFLPGHDLAVLDTERQPRNRQHPEDAGDHHHAGPEAPVADV